MKQTDPETLAYNREAWDRQVAESNMWTRPVSAGVIEAARRGEWSAALIGLQPTPRDWFPDEIAGLDVLCLASGGGQQGPLLAAAGARVTVFDNSPAQLELDRTVSDTHDLGIETRLGDMADLSAFSNESFDVVFHPVSNVFVPNVRPVWQEAFRVLRPGGRLLAGFMNPACFIFDYELFEKTGERRVRYPVPFADARDLPPEELADIRERRQPVTFGHTLADQIGGQLEAGFQLVGFDEGERGELEQQGPLEGYLATYIATCAVKPG